jgi:SAM-dependent methyltransferase
MPGDEDLLGEHQWGSGSGPEFLGPRHEYRESLILRRLRVALQTGDVLNAGAGAGSLTESLITRGYRVTSVDMSEQFVDRLRAVTAGRGEVEWADLTKLQFADASFDAVVCGEVLEHVADDLAAMRELRRVLRPGGVFVATVPANPWRYDWFDKWVGHVRRYSAEGMEGRLREAGFDEVHADGWGFPITGFYHRQAYMRLVRRRLRASRGAGAVAPADTTFATGNGSRSSSKTRLAMRAFRLVLELDTPFIGRRPGYFGLLVTARVRTGPPGPRTPAPPA